MEANSDKISVSVISEVSVSQKAQFEKAVMPIEEAEDAEMKDEEAGEAQKAWEANEVVEEIEVEPEISKSESSAELIQRRTRRRKIAVDEEPVTPEL